MQKGQAGFTVIEEFSVRAEPGQTILDAVLDAGLDLEHECGGNCGCTTCRVRVEAGAESLSPIEEPEMDRLALEDIRGPGYRLACQAILVAGELKVVTPDGRRFRLRAG
ncbi:MAG TPA: 2Fe-2S iron-sulfur cluster-binding protein [Chthonomonadales bacterium]|nr:2Fe-2S iron-sulfur cluster-binding protein [Chthonomonadales bacterium]